VFASSRFVFVAMRLETQRGGIEPQEAHAAACTAARNASSAASGGTDGGNASNRITALTAARSWRACVQQFQPAPSTAARARRRTQPGTGVRGAQRRGDMLAYTCPACGDSNNIIAS